MARLTKRISWRWIPDPPEETTDTLVQNVGDWYVDLRLSKKDGSLDYAFAGTETILEKGPGDYQTIQWTKKISSRGSTRTFVFDVIKPVEGDFLEIGEVAHFETGVLTGFRERWRPMEIPSTDELPFAWILESIDGKEFLGLVGGVFQALRGYDGEGGMVGFCARREIFEDKSREWASVNEAGHAENARKLPSMRQDSSSLNWQNFAMEGETVEAFGGTYVIRAIEKLS